MTQNHKAWMIFAVVAFLVVLYWTRYQIINAGDVPGFYRINRLTGEVTYIVKDNAYRVRE